MGKDKMSKKSKLKLAAKKCRPIKSYFATKIPTTLDEAGHPTPNRNFACAEDDVVDAIADAASVFSVSADDYDEGARPPRQVDTSSLILMRDGGGSVVKSYSTFSPDRIRMQTIRRSPPTTRLIATVVRRRRTLPRSLRSMMT